eukprot:1195773-Prorocentrum_minimum.AAC.4
MRSIRADRQRPAFTDDALDADDDPDADASSEPPGSLLDVLGKDMTAILVPVSICMAFVVLLVCYLPPTAAVNDLTTDIGTLYYNEQVSS